MNVDLRSEMPMLRILESGPVSLNLMSSMEREEMEPRPG